MNVPFLDVQAAYRELKDPIDTAVMRVLESGWYILGEEVEQFEKVFASYSGADHCVGVGNGLDALVLGLTALGIGSGDEVIVPANTYIATWLAVSAVGATCVPVDPDENGCNLNLDIVEKLISDKTCAIIPVHLYGHPMDVVRTKALADEHGLKVIEDCAQAHGAKWQGISVGSTSDVGCYSFYPGKNLGALGDGGAVVTSDADVADKLRLLRNYGSKHKYSNDVKGANSRLDSVQAAVLKVKLDWLDEWNERRSKIARRYVESFEAISNLKMLFEPQGSQSVWHQFPIRTERRDKLQEVLNQSGIGTMIHYPVPPHLSEAYQSERLDNFSLPVTELSAAELLSLPIGPHLSEQQQSYVIATVIDFFKK